MGSINFPPVQVYLKLNRPLQKFDRILKVQTRSRKKEIAEKTWIVLDVPAISVILNQRWMVIRDPSSVKVSCESVLESFVSKYRVSQKKGGGVCSGIWGLRHSNLTF